MKNKFRFITLITFLVSVFWYGCQQEAVSPDADLFTIPPQLSNSSGVQSEYKKYDLLAGQDMPVGEVQVHNDATDLYVKFVITDPDWCLEETHLAVATSVEEIPQTKKGNPIPGQFDYSHILDCADADEYTVALEDVNATCDDELIIAAHAVVLNKTTCADPVVLLATENNHPSEGDTEMEARIWSITPTGTSIQISDIPAGVRGLDTDNFNGNAYDASTNRFYFTDFGKNGGPFNQGPSPMFFNDLTGNQQYAGKLTGGAACGTFYDGKYYYVSTRTDDFYEVTFKPDGTIETETQLADIFENNGKVLAFGDISVHPKTGIIYGSATEIPGFKVVFFSMEIDGSDYNVIKTGALYGAGGTQIAFGADGVLYGVNARTPFELFSIDPANGNTTFIEETPVAYSDLAAGPICEPQTETGWGDGTDFPGNNWATYINYNITCCQDAIYLTDGGGGRPTTLNTVVLNDDNTATITEIFNFGTVPGGSDFNPSHFASHVHIGTSPDGSIIYVVDGISGYFGEYEVATGVFTEKDQLKLANGGTVGGLIQAAVSPTTGVLYVASNADNVYRVNGTTLTLLGSTGVRINGADLTFVPDGTLYVYINTRDLLYEIDLHNGKADEASGVQIEAGSITGLATVPGSSTLLMSDTSPSAGNGPNIIIKVNPDGSGPVEYIMTDFAHYWGDMASSLCAQ